MIGFGSWFAKPAAETSSQSMVRTQSTEVEAELRRFLSDFKDRTKLHAALIFPVMFKVAVKLFIEDFGAEVALRQYEALVASLTSDGMIRENQYTNFNWPQIDANDAPLVKELDTLLWRFVRELTGRGYLKEAIAKAILDTAMQASTEMNALVSAGYLITIVKELRAGIYTPPPEVRPEAAKGTDEVTTIIFNHFRDMAYKLKERLGLEWQHLLPGMQRVGVICCIKYRGRDGALALYRDQVQKLAPILDQSPKNPPQNLPLTELHVKNIETFNEAYLGLANDGFKNPDLHPLWVAHALSMLIMELTTKHYDLTFLSSIIASSCADIERGKYNSVAKTH
ncbi:hypothetical protein [Bradyrhizobium glycinis]|uniref:hypothetical protein n=1 Tax=Bradyrhizobium glycinis TaxID=2751812 RepID=UPI0018D60F59|nr:hypothetical protein [Bradyrhizobium glycinis]MBH5370451.1 hypothetical protein [Bradyrhizobium glycinis]